MCAAALRVVSLESRRALEQARLLERRGFEVMRAPSMREVPIETQTEALAFGDVLFADECDVLVLLTGVGTRMLVDALSTRWSREDVIERLRASTLCCRGPKPVAALRELGLSSAVTAPEPNTWRELLDVVGAQVPLRGKRCWVQEYGRRNDELLDGLRAKGAIVSTVPIYAWQLPEDVGPLSSAIAALAERRADAVVFTSAQQLDHVMQVAERDGCKQALLDALREHVLVASIGPITTEVLQEHGIAADIEPEHPKMGHLVLALAEHAASRLADKRARS